MDFGFGGLAEVFVVYGGILLSGAVGVSYFVQILPILRTRSATGLSPATFALNAVACALVALNVVVLVFFGPDAPGVDLAVPAFQASVSTPLSAALLVLVARAHRRYAGVVLYACTATAAAFAAGAALFAAPAFAVDLARALGMCAAAATAATWIPQMFAVAVAREPGQLSLAFLGMQALGGVFVLVYQVAVLDWSTWAATAISVVSMTVLIVMVAVVRRRAAQIPVVTFSLDELPADGDEHEDSVL